MPPIREGRDEHTTLGATARISMVRDPDGNWIGLPQPASIMGSLSLITRYVNFPA
jgi:hypothetical protein